MSRSNILGLKRELNSIRKNNDSIDVYAMKFEKPSPVAILME